MPQKPRRSESARTEQRIELHVQATIIIITIRNHRYSRDGGYRRETEHESSPTTPTAATRLTAEAAAAAAPLHDSTTTTTTNNNTRSNNRACSEVEAAGLRARPTPLQLQRFLQPRRLDPSSLGAPHHRHITYSCSVITASVRVHASGPRHKYCQYRTDKNTATHRAADRRSGSSTCKQCQQPTLVDQSVTRQVSDLGPPPIELTGRPS